MSIQFYCNGCGQPIEVDEPLAGKAARCPHCRTVVTVPASSTFRPENPIPPLPAGFSAATVRGTDMPALPGMPAQGGPQQWPGGVESVQRPRPAAVFTQATETQRRRLASMYGAYALGFVAVALALFAVTLATGAAVALGELKFSPDGTVSTPTRQQQVELAEKLHERYPWLQITEGARILCLVAGLVFSLLGFYQHRPGNWKLWLSVCAGGGLLLMQCVSVLWMVLAG